MRPKAAAPLGLGACRRTWLAAERRQTRVLRKVAEAPVPARPEATSSAPPPRCCGHRLGASRRPFSPATVTGSSFNDPWDPIHGTTQTARDLPFRAAGSQVLLVPLKTSVYGDAGGRP